MKSIIITNNPVVREKFENIFFVDGSVEDTFIKVRDMVHDGYELISHPLAASIRLMYSPYRSVIIGKRLEKVDPLSAQIIEDSIIKYKLHTDHRKKDMTHHDDYQNIDLILLESALSEQQAFW
ncbi:GrdX family protein [Dehalobacterium formicoaceticum]|uniref:GrdX family protein n=1 Tax=Dehalobacterium formicoaceticum TaxID=51515 RepID=UPI000B7DAA8F|nr:GrdX family protein [Dehalobacterium formicoaceticum]